MGKNLSQARLKALGGWQRKKTGCHEAPSYSAYYNLLGRMDAAAFDAALCQWRSCLLLCAALAGCQTSFPRVAQPVYPSPGPALDSLLAAMREDNIPAAEIILGLRLDEILSGDPVSDKMDKKNFLKLAGQQTHVRKVTDTTAWLDCGPERWTFPVPVVKDGDT